MKKILNEILLIKNVKGLGKSGTIVKVKAGYSRNYLLPLKFAKLATSESIKQFKLENQRSLIKEQNSVREFIKLKTILEALDPLTLEKEVVYETEQLFGKVTKNEIFSLLTEKINFPNSLKISQIQLPNIKELGIYQISIKLNKDITTTISLILKSK